MNNAQAFAVIVLVGSFGLLGCAVSTKSNSARKEAQSFLDTYTKTYLQLAYESSQAEWASNTRIVEGDETNKKRTEAANEALAKFTGSIENIEACRRFLGMKDQLTEIQKLQLERILYAAADKPQTVPDLVKQRIAAEATQTEKLFGFDFKLDGESITTNAIDEKLRNETDMETRRKVWEASKEVGPTLREGLMKLRELRNATVRALGYKDYFTYQVSEYGMSTPEMMALVEKINRELRPLYRELHTWARYELAKKFNQPVPDLLPAHWLPNRWGQGWDSMVQVAGLDLDAKLKEKTPEWLVRQAEKFYVSLGFEPLPKSFYEKSSLYPLPQDAGFKKNNHASAWHLDLDHDVRSLMSVESNADWYETTHHELGHIYYYLSYTNPDVPPLLRGGANRAYHEAIGSLMGLAAMQPRFAASIGLLEGNAKPDATQALLKEALNYVVFIPWSTGTMSRFEHDLYTEELSPQKWNARWWELAAMYQGIAPPSPRGEEFCDAATKTHINDDAAQYYDYALSFVLLFQIHDHIAKKILHEDPRDTNYFGRKDVGKFLQGILRPGASADWRKLLKQSTGEDLSASAMLDYFAPLMEWLKKENAGRKHTLPEIAG